MSSIHASAVRFGGTGVLIRGASGAGKSRLAQMLLLRGGLFGHEARLVADDRVLLEELDGRLIARAPEAIAGLIEVRGLGIVRFPHLSDAALDLVIDLVPASDLPRLPTIEELQVTFGGVTLPRAFASSPESGLEILLILKGQSGAVPSRDIALASVRFDGKTERP